MNMSKDEIVTDYRQAKTKQTQIGILAELNACTKKEIVEILRKAGEELPRTYDKKAPARKTAEQKITAAAPKHQAAEPEYLSIRKLFELVEGSIAADTREVELTIGGRQVTKVDFRGVYTAEGTRWKVNLE